MDMGKQDFADWLVNKRKSQGYRTRRDLVDAVKNHDVLKEKGLDFSLSTLSVVENAEHYPSVEFIRTVAIFFGEFPEDLQRIVYPDDFRPSTGRSADSAHSTKARLVAEELAKLPEETLDLFLSLARQYKSVSNSSKVQKKS